MPHVLRSRVVVQVVACVLGLLTGVAAVGVASSGGRPDAKAAAPAPVAASEPASVRVLRDWDKRRARAYARGDPAALARLYADGSRTGAADVALLRSYLRRGLRVTRLRTQLLGATVVSDGGDRLVLRVTDLLAGGLATDGRRRWPLPRDQPSARRVVLTRSGGAWRVVETYDASAQLGQT
jgi:hypothetical protein